MPKKKRGRSSGGKKSFIDRIPVLRNKTVQKIGFGLGMGVLVIKGIELVSRFAPPQFAQPLQQNAGLIKVGVELVTEPLSALVDVATNPQMLSRITSGFSGNNPNNGGMSTNQNMVGFA